MELKVHEDERLKVWVIREKQRRRFMEDETIVASLPADSSLLAVFDGHFGPAAARFCSRYFAKYLQQDEAYIQGDVSGSLHRVFMQMDRLMWGSRRALECLYPPSIHKPDDLEDAADAWSERNTDDMVQEEHGFLEWDKDHPLYWEKTQPGTTATVALVLQNKVVLANAGDSYCCVVRGDHVLDLTVDHNLGHPAEKARVERAGCEVDGSHVTLPGKRTTFGGINMTRALGDLQLKSKEGVCPELQVISAVPDIVEMDITSEDEYLVLASDGIAKWVLKRGCWPKIRRSCETNTGWESWWMDLRVGELLVDNMTLIVAKLKRAASEGLASPTPVRRFSWFTENKVEGYEPEVLDMVPKPEEPVTKPKEVVMEPKEPERKKLWESILEGIPLDKMSLREKDEACTYLRKKFDTKEADMLCLAAGNMGVDKLAEELRHVGRPGFNFCDAAYAWLREYFYGFRGPSISRENRLRTLEVITKATLDFFYYGREVCLKKGGRGDEEWIWIMETQVAMLESSEELSFFEPIPMTAALNFLLDYNVVQVEGLPETFMKERGIGKWWLGGWWQHLITRDLDRFWQAKSGKLPWFNDHTRRSAQRFSGLASEICPGEQQVLKAAKGYSYPEFLSEDPSSSRCKFLIVKEQGVILFRVRFEDGAMVKCAVQMHGMARDGWGCEGLSTADDEFFFCFYMAYPWKEEATPSHWFYYRRSTMPVIPGTLEKTVNGSTCFVNFTIDEENVADILSKEHLSLLKEGGDDGSWSLK